MDQTNTYQSNEELYFSWWLDELQSHGIIKKYFYESNTFKLSEPASYPVFRILKTKTKLDSLSLLQSHEYTPDFLCEWNSLWRNKAYRYIQDDTCQVTNRFFAKYIKNKEADYSFFEIKGSFDYNNMTRLFRVSQKWMYDKYKIYIHLSVIPKLFKETFTPTRYLYTDGGKQLRKIDFDIISIDKWLRTL